MVGGDRRLDRVAHPGRVLGLDGHVVVPRVALGLEVDGAGFAPKETRVVHFEVMHGFFELGYAFGWRRGTSGEGCSQNN